MNEFEKIKENNFKKVNIDNFDLIKYTNEEKIILPTLLSFFSCMNFTNLLNFIVVNENLEKLNSLNFKLFWDENKKDFVRKLDMQSDDYIVWLKEYGFYKVLRWQIDCERDENDMPTGFVNIIVCIDY